ncbi:hypothetical protein PV10_05795 [Exophiala mesophila]|uniref:FAD-binding FR-type domain-containing protein n=1 Tax=Exophiala mesophila TaxID=212818 RepID=A0A0D1ZB70_EXOME|nr:uncharacterized protein PV10_05795 [Exophiala mesophila]KIV91234.1 hypothetical protein PV10_05795 [Exophiala mesophila]
MLGYKFINLSPEQVEIRRQQLDRDGFLAWLTPIILLTVIYIYRRLYSFISYSARDQNHSHKSATPHSWPRRVYRRAAWILNTTYVSEFGPLRVQILGLFYVAWLISLAARHTGNDYMHITKALGHVAVSQLPIHYLLSFKSPMSPISIATGVSHEQLNPYHRLLGRLIHGFLAAHAVLYIRFFVVLDLLAKRIQHRDVRLGVLAFWSFNFLGLLAIPPIRRKLYHKVFYRSHVVLSAIVVPILFFHVPYTRKYVVQAGVLWFANGLARSRASSVNGLTVTTLPDTNLVLVNLTVNKSRAFAEITPGQHVYVRRKGLGPRNPFSIVHTTPSESGKAELDVSLVLRDLQGPQTAYLSGLASKGLLPSLELSIEGPYGDSSHYLPRLISSSRQGDRSQVLLIAGGVGATYSLPMYLALVKARRSTEGLKLIWLVKSQSEAQWGLDVLQTAHVLVDVDIYVTGPSHNGSCNIKGVTVNTEGSRPDLASIIDDIMAFRCSFGKVTVMLCGPPGLSRVVRAAVGRQVLSYGREVEWHEEQFGFGGS